MRSLQILFASWALALAAQVPPPAPILGQAAAQAVTGAVPDAPDLAKVIAPLSDALRAAYGKVLANAPRGILRYAGPGERPMGFWVADLMREGASRAIGAEVRIAITNSGGLRRDLPAGAVRAQDLYEVLPFDNQLVIAEYTGQELLAIIREGLLRKGGEPCSGLRVSVSGTREKLAVSVTWSDGSPFEPGATYQVATSDYLLAAGDATPTLKAGRHVILTGVPLRQLVIDACARLGRAGRPILPPEGARYAFSPELAQAIRALNLHS